MIATKYLEGRRSNTPQKKTEKPKNILQSDKIYRKIMLSECI